MAMTQKTAWVAAATIMIGAGGVKAETMSDVLEALAAAGGVTNTTAFYDFNDFSISELFKKPGNPSPAPTPDLGDVILGVLEVESISVFADIGGFPGAVPLASVTLATTDVQLTGVFALEALAVTGTFGAYTGIFAPFPASTPALITAGDMFEFYEDSRSAGTDADFGSLDPIAYDTMFFKDGSLFATLGLGAFGSYTLTPVISDLAITPVLALTGGSLASNTTLNASPFPITGTGTVSLAGSTTTFTDRASFVVSMTVVPAPAAVWPSLGMAVALVGYSVVRRRRMAKVA